MAYPLAQPDPTSVIGRRVLAVVIDALLIWIVVGAIASADFEYHTTDSLKSAGITGEQYCNTLNDRGDFCIDLTDVEGVDAVYFSDGWSGATQLSFWLVPVLLLVVLQGLTGWTPGKLITGIRTVREDGRTPGLVKALVRWLLWIVDGFPWVIPGLVGFITGLTTPGHRRVGDMAAKTFVVRRAAAGAPIAVPGLTAAPPVAAPWGAQPPVATTPGGWPAPQDATTPGWASPTPPTPPVATPAPAPVPTDGPQWDEVRGTYIQWDPDQRAWMQWDDGSKVWTLIPGQ